MVTQDLARRITQGCGREPAETVLKGGRWFDLVTGNLIESDIAISGDTIVGTHENYSGTREIDISGKIVVPGFIDTHLHVESSCITPYEFDRCVTPRGITTAICDPHEIANVCGIDGLRYFLDCAEQTVMDLRVQLSSCVPSTAMETSGAKLAIHDLMPLTGHPKVIGLAEFMNYPGVLNADPDCLAKLAAFQDGHIDGHAPLLRGHDLNGYLAAGIRTDHETTNTEEALEKLAKGMHILVREGSVSKDLDALLPIITERHSPFLSLCTDDRNPLDIAEHGHLDYMIRHAISKGVEPLAIYRAASISAARAFGLRDRGLIGPGWRADLVVLDTLEECRAARVFVAGQEVTADRFGTRTNIAPIGRHSVQTNLIEAASFHIQAPGKASPVIGIEPGKIITQHLSEVIAEDNGASMADATAGIAKIAIIERHGKNGNIACGFVRGFGMKRGAIASTVCHDHHNIAVVGMNDSDMALAANHLAAIEGGFTVVADGEILAQCALQVAGLMSLQPFETVRDQLHDLRNAARSLGVILDEPFLQLAFLALPVIPHLKITDHGMVDVDQFAVIS